MPLRWLLGRDAPWRRCRHPLAAALLASTTLLQGCSWVPDWANPVEWYDGIFSDSGTKPEAAAKPPPPTVAEQAKKQEESKEFPKLASVPERPNGSSSSERKTVREGLLADRESARYTDEVLRGGPGPEAEATARTAEPPSAPNPPAERPVAAAKPPAASPAPAPAPPQQVAAAAPAPAPAPAPKPAVAPGSAAAAAAPAVSDLRSRPPAATVQEVYQAALAQSAATVTTAPAHAAFNPPHAPGIGQFSTAVPPIVQQTYMAALQQSAPPPVANYPGTLPPAGVRQGGGAVPLPTPAQRAAFIGAGSMRVATIQFPNGSAHISGKDRAALSDVVAAHNTRGGIIRVVGYASSRTRDMSLERHKLVNFDVSQRRAEAVAAELIRQGAQPQSVFVEARSDTLPVYSEAMPRAERNNRRAEIFLEN